MGKTVVFNSPNPTLILSFSAKPVMMMVSPSSRNVRVDPSGSWIGFLPPHVISNSEPKLLGVVPEIVPEASRSPMFRLQPLMVWWAICWAADQ